MHRCGTVGKTALLRPSDVKERHSWAPDCRSTRVARYVLVLSRRILCWHDRIIQIELRWPTWKVRCSSLQASCCRPACVMRSPLNDASSKAPPQARHLRSFLSGSGWGECRWLVRLMRKGKDDGDANTKKWIGFSHVIGMRSWHRRTCPHGKSLVSSSLQQHNTSPSQNPTHLPTPSP